MVELKIRLYKDSSGVLLGGFLDGLNGISQNNANVNEVLVIVDGFELAPGEVLRISYEEQNGAEHIDYTLMNDNGNGTYSAEIDYAVTNGTPNSIWELGLQIASNWVENELYKGYMTKQNLANTLWFLVHNTVRDRNNLYPSKGDLAALYQAAQQIISEVKEPVAEVKQDVAEVKQDVAEVKQDVQETQEFVASKGQPNGIATLDESGKVPKEQLPENLGGNGTNLPNSDKEIVFVDVMSMIANQDNALFVKLSGRYIRGEIIILCQLQGQYANVSAVSASEGGVYNWSITAPTWQIESMGVLLDHANIAVFGITNKDGYIAYGLREYRISNNYLTPQYVVDVITGDITRDELTDDQKDIACDWVGAVRQGYYANANNAGVVKADYNYGLYVGSTGLMSIYKATNDEIKNKQQVYRPIVPATIEYATMYALADCKDTTLWTDDTTVDGVVTKGTKTKACETIGAVKESYVNNLPDNLTEEQKKKWISIFSTEEWTFTLEDGTTVTKKVVVSND